jgi:hypothetical protein
VIYYQEAKGCGSQQYQVKISNRFAALKNMEHDDMDIKRVWEVLEYESFSHRESRLLLAETA